MKMEDNLVQHVAAGILILLFSLMIAAFIIFAVSRRHVLRYLFKNYGNDELERWGLAASRELTRYAKWGAITRYAEESSNTELLKKLRVFRASQLFVSDITVITMATLILFVWTIHFS
jgi:hypothetical protein